MSAMNPTNAERPFRVIVVGGGVAGLTASHCLQKAGIEHVVLERRGEIAPPEGASIAIYPHGALILGQIGCLEAAKKACVPCNRWFCRWPDGTTLSNNGFPGNVKENHGQDIILLERRKFLQILYDELPDKSRVRMNSHVKDIRQHVSGVEVTLSDGTVETGDVVVGCDGVHSRTRTLMWEHAGQTAPGLITAREKACFKTRWKCLVGMSGACPELGERDMTVVHDKGYSFLSLTQPDAAFFFYFFRLSKDEEFTWPQRSRYTAADADALANSVAAHPVSSTLLFGELWARRTRGVLIDIEEGVLDHWHHGRIVLAGDAAHKVTPNIGLGGNTAMESVVVLCNALRRMMADQCGARPSQATLAAALARYQAECRDRALRIMRFSGLITGVQAWDSRLNTLLATWVMPLQPDRAVALQIGDLIRAAPRLDYVPVDPLPAGLLSWTWEGTGGEKIEADKKNAVAQHAASKTRQATLLRLVQQIGAAVTLLVLAYSARVLFPLILA